MMKTYRKTAHPTHKGGVQRWTETTMADTLNAFDNTDGRTPILVVAEEPIVFRDDITIKIDGWVKHSPLAAEILRECNA